MSASGQNTGSARTEVEVDQVSNQSEGADAAKEAGALGSKDQKPDFAGLIEKIANQKIATHLPRYSRILRRA